MSGYTLVTGGAGFIGAHAVVKLLEGGLRPLVLDNFSNSKESVIERIKKVTRMQVEVEKVDILDKARIDSVFDSRKIDSVMHFAGLKAVGESAICPIDYYKNNVEGTITLLDCMLRHGVNNLIFSSSATVYSEGDPPFAEELAISRPISPYGATKAMIERIIDDVVKATPRLKAVALRYFNPVGAHRSGLIGEDPRGVPNNLVPYITQVASGKLEKLRLFGDDYETKDGTCERDYIHIADLVDGHLAALKWIEKQSGLNAIEVFNLGTGKPHSVREVIRVFEEVSGLIIPFEITARRPGDLPRAWADVEKSQRDLRWAANLGLHSMLEDCWRWQVNNPNGYPD